MSVPYSGLEAIGSKMSVPPPTTNGLVMSVPPGEMRAARIVPFSEKLCSHVTSQALPSLDLETDGAPSDVPATCGMTFGPAVRVPITETRQYSTVWLLPETSRWNTTHHDPGVPVESPPTSGRTHEPEP